MSVAGVAHLVERHLAKVEVASSSLVARSIEQIRKYLLFFALISKEPLSLRTDEYRADWCGSF